MIETVEVEGFRLSPRQRRLWGLVREDGDAAYRTAAAVTLDDDADRDALAAALADMVERHEILRTAFPVPTGLKLPVQAIAEPPPPFAWAEAPAAGDDPLPLRRLLAEHAAAGPDAGAYPVADAPAALRVAVADSADHGTVLLLSLSPLVADRLSAVRLVAELGEAYAARRRGMAPEAAFAATQDPLQAADVAEWLNELLEGEDGEDGRSQWRLDLSAVPLALPSLGEGDGAFSPARLPVTLGDDLRASLERATQEVAVPPAALFLAAWWTVLERRLEAVPGDAPGLAVACTLDGRTVEDLADAVGPLAVTVPLLLEPTPAAAPVAERVSRAAGALDKARRYQEFFSWDEVRPPAGLAAGATPWLPLAFEVVEEPEVLSPAGSWRPLAVTAAADRFTVKLLVDATATPAAWLEYDAGRVTASAARALADAFAATLGALAGGLSNPCRWLPALAPSEERRLKSFNASARDLPTERTLDGLFADLAAESPSRVAVAAGGAGLARGELLSRADALARRLLAAGVTPGQPVGVGVPRSPELLVAVLGVLRAGAAYLPLDPDYPAARLSFMLADSGATVLITGEDGAAPFGDFAGTVLTVAGGSADDAGVPEAPPEDPDRLAYLIYTSGSTGRPKAVAVSHGAAVNHMAWMIASFGIGPEDRVLQRTPLSFDASVWELFVPLLSGATMVLDAPGNRFDAAALLARCADAGVTVLQAVPSMLRLLVEEPAFAELGSLRLLFSGGEALPRAVAVAAAEASGARVVNLYGPTESTIDATSHALVPEGEGPVPIGRPVANVRAWVMDRSLRPLPPGITGELCLAGRGLARGYLGRPAATAERFVPDPYTAEPGGRLYRSGDLARLGAGDELVFAGRVDHQVKLRGFRIELGEVEEVLAAHPGIAAAAAVVLGGPEEPRLVAYWVPAAAPPPTVDELRSALEERLPEHMVPALFVSMDELPTTPSGKVDRAALPDPGHQRPDLDQEYVAPRNLEEELLASIWAEVLGVEDVGIRDNFFALGADSIRSVRVVAQARERGLDLSLQLFFEHQTIEELVAAMRRGSGEAAYVETEPFSLVPDEDRERLPDGLVDAYPLSGLQHGMLYHMEVDPTAPVYHNVTGFHIEGDFHAEAFQRAVDRAVERHEVLRTSFDMESYSEPLQLVHPRAHLEVEVRELRHLSPAEQKAAVDARVEEQRNTPFDLRRPPLLRFFVERVADDRFWFVLTECHSILDGWSLTSILREIFSDHFRFADGLEPAEEPPLELTFRDYVALERRARGSEESRNFWRRQLDGAELLRVPRRRSTFEAEGDSVAVTNLPVPLGDLGERVLSLAHRLAVPVKSVCLAAHVKALSLIAGRDDVVTGLPTNGRPDHPDGERIRGLFINTVPFRVDLEQAVTWGDLARSAFEHERRILPHRRYPLDAMRKQWSDEPLFEVLFSFVHFHHMESLLAAGRMRFLDDFKGWEANNFTLMVGFNRHPPELDLKMRLYYNAHELSRQQVASYGGLLTEIFRAMTAEPEAAHGGFDPAVLIGDHEAALLDNATAVDELDDDFIF